MKKEKTIKVIVFEPNKEGEVREIFNTLESMQEIVGGMIEYTLMDETDKFNLVCNEEGKLIGLEENRYIHVIDDVIMGTFFITKTNYRTGEAVSLTDKDIENILLEGWSELS